jgi:hypothetical protein
MSTRQIGEPHQFEPVLHAFGGLVSIHSRNAESEPHL